MSQFQDQPLPFSAATRADLLKPRFRTADRTVIYSAGGEVIGDSGAVPFIYRKSGRSALPSGALGGFYIAGPKDDDYFEFSDKTRANVKHFNARGDGATDDSTAVQKAIDSGASIIEMPAGTYLCNVEIPTRVTVIGASNNFTTLKPYDNDVACFNQTAAIPFWTYASKYINLRFTSQATGAQYIGKQVGTTVVGGVGFTFGKTNPADYETDDEYANNAVFDGCYFYNLEKGVQHPAGNIGTTFYNCGWQLNKYGVYCLDSKFGSPGIMHAGNKYWYEGEFSANECAVYIDGEIYGAAVFVLNNTLFQFNSIAFYMRTLIGGSMTLNEVYFENNGEVNGAYSPATVVLDNWSEQTRTTATYDKHTFIIEGNDWNIKAHRGGLYGDISMPDATNSQFLIEGANVERSAGVLGGECDVGDTSVISVKDCPFTISGPFVTPNCISNTPYLFFKNQANNYTQSSSRWWIGRIARSVRGGSPVVSNQFDTLQAMAGFSNSLVTDDTAPLGVCNRYTRNPFTNAEYGSPPNCNLPSTDDAWYTVVLNIKVVTGSLFVYVWQFGLDQVYHSATVPENGKWFTIYSIVKCSAGQQFKLDFRGNDVNTTFDVGGYQVCRFDSEIEAAKFLNDGVFYLEDVAAKSQAVDVVAYASTINVNFDTGNGFTKDITLTGNATINLTAVKPGEYTLIIRQDSTGFHSVTWGSGIYFAGLSATALPRPNAVTTVKFQYDGTTFVGPYKEPGLLLDSYPSAVAAYSYGQLKTGVSSYVTGTTNASAWLDQSGNGNNLAQATGSKQPAILAGGLSFDGTDDTMSATFTLEQPYTLFMRVKLGAYDNSENFSLNNVIDGITPDAGMIRRTPNGTPGTLMDVYSGSTLYGTLLGSDNEEMMITVLFDGANSKLWKNGTLLVTGDAGSTDPGGIVLGSYSDGTQRFSQQVVRHLVIYPSDVTADRAAIEDMLK